MPNTTTLYTITRDSELVEFATYQDASIGAPAVWSVLAPKYLDNVDGRRGGNGRHWMSDEKVIPEMVMGAASMSVSDRFALLITADFTAIRTEDLPGLADQLDVFVLEHAEDLEGTHIATFAADLRRVIAVADANNWAGVCWDHTSACEDRLAQSITWASSDPAAVFGVVASRSAPTIARIRALV